jgi:metal-responsive CopG/Arc/MetJ family transcriptional regulator
MRLIVERWIIEKNPETNEEEEKIAEESVVKDEEEAKKVAEEYREKQDTVRVTLHYCYNDENPTKPCKRVEI